MDEAFLVYSGSRSVQTPKLFQGNLDQHLPNVFYNTAEGNQPIFVKYFFLITFADSLNSSGNNNNVFVYCAGHIWYNTWSHSIQCKYTNKQHI